MNQWVALKVDMKLKEEALFMSDPLKIDYPEFLKGKV